MNYAVYSQPPGPPRIELAGLFFKLCDARAHAEYRQKTDSVAWVRVLTNLPIEKRIELLRIENAEIFDEIEPTEEAR
jgi:hypothetical protein